MSLSSRSIRRPVAVAMFFVAVALLGMISFNRLPIDLLPDVSYPRLVVYTTNPDVGPAEIERFITTPVEQAVATIAGVEEVTSISREGISLVTISFAWGTNMDFAVLNVREQLDNVRGRLPEMVATGGTGPTVLRTDPQSEPIMAISIAGGGLQSLKELSETVFRRRLEQIDGVAQAAVTGGLEREIHVNVDARRLQAYNITLDQIATALEQANASRPGGAIRQGQFQYPLRMLGEFETVQEIERVVVRNRVQGGGSQGDGDGASTGGQASPATAVIRVRDIAEVDDGFQEREAIARYNGREAIGLLLFKESDANTVRVAESVEGVLTQLRDQYDELEFEIAMNQATFISDSISNVVQALILGGVLAFLVLFLFLRDARYPVAVALAIPISVVGAFSLLDAVGVSLNIMSLGGLALGVGMLVDNSIVVLENIFRHREEGKGPLEAAALGAEEVQGAITAATLTTISVFGPIIYVEGVAGELFGALSYAVAFSLLASLIVALTLLPTMASRTGAVEDVDVGRLRRGARALGRGAGRLLSRIFSGPLAAFDRRFDRFADWYHALLGRALEHRGRVVAITLVLFVGTIAVAWVLPRSVLPEVDQGAFTVRLDLPQGTPLDETAAETDRLEALLLADAGIDAVFTRIGRQAAVGGVPDEESGPHTASLEVRLVEGERTRRVLDRLAAGFAGYPPGRLVVETGSATALGQILGGIEADIAVRVQGDDLDAMIDHADAVAERLADVGSITNVRVGADRGQPEIRVEIDRERAAAFGIRAQTVAQAVEGYMLGRVATEFVAFDRKIPVIVRLPDEARRSQSTLERLSVDGIALREVIRTEPMLGPSEVRRLDQTRTVPVYADVARGGLDAALRDVELALAGLPAPAGLRTDIGGENEEMRRSFRDLAFAFGLALLLVYMIMAAQFESFVHPFTILLAVPLATIGAVAALGLAGAGLNTMSLIGFVILVGIVVNDSIIKVDFINQMRARGMELRQAILEAGRVRLRPIVMTTVTTVLGLTPMALGVGRGADLRAPLAIAVIGGLLTATALTLIVVPVAYDLIEDVRAALRRAFGRDPTAAPAPATMPATAPDAVPAGGTEPEDFAR